jgi:hypothetical protein
MSNNRGKMSKKKKLKKINEDVALEIKPNFKAGDYVKLPPYPNMGPDKPEKVTEVFDEPGLPKDWRGIKGMGVSTVMKVYPKEVIDKAWWFVVDHSWVFPFFPDVIKKVPPPPKKDLYDRLEEGMDKLDIHKEDKNMSELYDGYGNPSKAPVKVGDEVVDINIKNPQKVKVLAVVYGSPEKLKADKVPSAEDVQSLFGSGGRKLWWIVVDGATSWGRKIKGSIAVPYGHDGFVKVEDAKDYYKKVEEEDTEESVITRLDPMASKLLPVKTMISNFTPQQKELYNTMSPKQKEIFHTLIASTLSGAMKKQAEPVTEARSLLKDEPTKEEDTGRTVLVPKCKECGKELRVTGNIASCQNPECSLKGKEITVNPEKGKTVAVVSAPQKKLDEAAFTKQHYIAIANILKTAKTKDEIVNQLVTFFKKDNPLFDQAKFVAYVGQEQKPTAPQE